MYPGECPFKVISGDIVIGFGGLFPNLVVLKIKTSENIVLVAIKVGFCGINLAL